MAIVKKTVLTKQTAAETVIKHVSREAVGSTMQVDGSLGTDVIAINLVGADGITMTPAFDIDGIAMQFDATRTSLTFFGRGDFQFVKPSTTSAVGLIWVR